MTKTQLENFEIRFATEADVPLILDFIIELAEYEKLRHAVTATPAGLRESLFGAARGAEVIIGEFNREPVAFALFFHNFSTFLGKRGLYLEDLFVKPSMRGRGIGRILMSYLAKLARARSCGRFEWWVLDWNAPAIRFYESIGAEAMSDWTVYRISEPQLAALAGEFDD